MGIELQRVYEASSSSDGYRVLVDRMWPRGVSKTDLQLDDWIKPAAPSNELRQWFHNNRSQWGEFRKRYLAELREHRDTLRPLAGLSREKRVLLLFASKDTKRNNAVVLREYLRRLGGI